MKTAIRIIVAAAVIVSALLIYRSLTDRNRLQVSPEAAEQIEKAKER
jgi:hypothetical protein